MEIRLDDVRQFLKNNRNPLKCDEIAKHFRVRKNGLRNELNKWCEKSSEDGEGEPKIAKIETGQNIYYTVNDGITCGEMNHMAVYMATYLAHMRDYFEETEKNAKSAKEGIKEIYAQIISLMTIFISIFSLIIINANIMTSLMDKEVNDIISSCVIINGCTLMVIVVLIVLIRLIIVRPLSKK